MWRSKMPIGKERLSSRFLRFLIESHFFTNSWSFAMKRQLMNYVLYLAAIGAASAMSASTTAITADDKSDADAIQAEVEAFVNHFNSANVEAVVGCFLPRGELVDEEGNVYQGRDELKQLFTQYFAEFPGAKLNVDIESVRVVGDGLLIEEGTRSLSAEDGSSANVRYVTIRAKTDGQWRIASTRELKDDPAPSPGDRLAPLAWLVGEWVSEDDDAAVEISYRWDEDRNFLLGDIRSTQAGKLLMKSTQRIAWDPRAETVRSWLFDGDGGFAECNWTQVDDGWVIKTQATLPNGASGSATVTITFVTKDQFILRGTERVVGDSRIDDFELTVSRAPPSVEPAPAGPPAGSVGANASPVRDRAADVLSGQTSAAA